MNNARFFIIIVLILIAGFTAGCVSQSKFDQVTSELSLAQGQIQELTQDNDSLKEDYASLKSDYDTLKKNNDVLKVEHETLQSDLTGTKADLEETQATLENTKTDLADAISDISALESKLVKVKTKMDILKSMFVPSLSGEYINYTEAETFAWFLEMQTLVEKSNDTALQDEFETLIMGDSSEQDFANFIISLIKSISTDLE
jgi:outer membrane murein-binding lipoprotein Lpp